MLYTELLNNILLSSPCLLSVKHIQLNGIFLSFNLLANIFISFSPFSGDILLALIIFNTFLTLGISSKLYTTMQGLSSCPSNPFLAVSLTAICNVVFELGIYLQPSALKSACIISAYQFSVDITLPAIFF